MTGVIAIPCAEQARWSSFHACLAAVVKPDGTVTKFVRGGSPARNRNTLIKDALASQAEWVWFLDDDLVFDDQTLLKLLAHFENPAIEAVVPLSFMRRPPFQAIWMTGERSYADLMTTLPPPTDGLVALGAATFGGLLVRTSALARMTFPYVTLGQLDPESWNDDIYFCRKLADEAGVQLWGDSSVRLGHTMDVELWPHYDAELGGWSAVFARGTVPFLMQPWGQDDDAGARREQSAEMLAGHKG